MFRLHVSKSKSRYFSRLLYCESYWQDVQFRMCLCVCLQDEPGIHEKSMGHFFASCSLVGFQSRRCMEELVLDGVRLQC